METIHIDLKTYNTLFMHNYAFSTHNYAKYVYRYITNI